MWQIISEYLDLLIMMIGVYAFGKIILKESKYSNIIEICLFIAVAAIPQTIIILILDGTIKSLLMSVINVIFCKKMFNISYKKSIFLTILYMIIILVADFLEMYLVTEVLGLSKDFCFNSLAGSIISNLIVLIMFLIITWFLRKPLQKLMQTQIDNNKKIIILSVITFICIIMFFYTMGKKYEFSNDIFLYLFAIVILITVLFILIKQVITNNKILQEYDQLLEFMTTYEVELDNQRILRHETKNEFLEIRAQICDKQKEEKIVKYIDDILGDNYTIQQEKYAKFGYLPPNGIKGLCYFKSQEAEKKNVLVSVNISKGIKESTIFDLDLKKQRDFARILGVFLDNAIEASAESEGKQLGIEAYANSEKEFRMIISNTYNNEVNLEKMGRESFSTKGRGRGHGLLLVKQLMNHNQIFEIKTQVQNNIYSQTIIVKKKNK